MRQFLKYTMALIAILALCTPEAYAKRKTKQREEVITAEKGYGYELESPAASMVVQYKSVREEFFFEDGQTVPSMRIIREFKSKGFQDDTLSYDDAGKIIRVGKYRDFDVKDRVKIFDDKHSYLVKHIHPGASPYDRVKEMRLTDFDSHGNWTKAYYKGDTKTPALTRTIAYELTPEQESMLAANKLATEQDINLDKAVRKVFKEGFIGFIILCVGMCVLTLFKKDLLGGRLRWIVWLICGLPLATVAFLYGVEYVDDVAPGLKVAFRLVALAVYMILMYMSIKTMSRDRRISNSFITTINVIWSLWAFFIICPSVVSAILPNFFGRILSWVLGGVLFVINYGYTAARCPVCRNPHGLEFDHRSLEGYRTESNSSSSYKRNNPKVVGFSQTGGHFNAKVQTDTTRTTTTTTNTYEMVRDHYVCYECGYVELSSTFKGAMIAHNISSSTDKIKEKIDVNGWLD